MTSIGAEVGQKMRSAIKAKLLELNCYVDDELPDYVMVMVANKRTKSQMKEDLQLFLTSKTATFVDWLHIVLKKLKEVTVTNPEIYKKTAKRKAAAAVDIADVNVKKEKKDKKLEKKEKKEAERSPEAEPPKSLTDDLPINANKLAEQRKIIIMKENQSNNSTADVMQDNFDIPLLSEVNMSTEEELEDIERKIRSVKSRLGLLVESDEDSARDCISLKAEPEDMLEEETKAKEKPKETRSTTPPRRIEKTRITFGGDQSEQQQQTLAKHKSILERLGKRRPNEVEEEEVPKVKKTRISLSEFRKEEEELSSKEVRRSLREEKKNRAARLRPNETKGKESILSRLGVQSKVSVPAKAPEEPEEPFKNREVPSVVKIKPRVIPSDAPQANKTLLLKAMADAQRSVAQTPLVGSGAKPDALFTKRYKDKFDGIKTKTARRLSDSEKNKIKRMLSSESERLEDATEYVPTPIARKVTTIDPPKYVPNSTKTTISYNNNDNDDDDDDDDDDESDNDSTDKNDKEKNKSPQPSSNHKTIRQHFIVTLDGLDKDKFNSTGKPAEEKSEEKPSIKSRLDKKKSPSPIIFDMVTSPVKNKPNIPDRLPIIHAPPSVKNKERCKYWPTCRQGDKCEFVHPSSNCDKFPHCKFGDKCLYVHPNCKFASSCTRRDCPYSHLPGTKNASRLASASAPAKLSQQICKFFPHCTNINCSFFHPKPCKFGKYCKNQRECTFSHAFAPNKGSLTWRSQ